MTKKRHKLKRIMALVLALVMLLGTMPITAQAGFPTREYLINFKQEKYTGIQKFPQGMSMYYKWYYYGAPDYNKGEAAATWALAQCLTSDKYRPKDENQQIIPNQYYYNLTGFEGTQGTDSDYIKLDIKFDRGYDMRPGATLTSTNSNIAFTGQYDKYIDENNIRHVECYMMWSTPTFTGFAIDGLDSFAKKLNDIVITFDPNGGVGSIPSLNKYEGDYITIPKCTFVAPSQKKFAGWQIGDDTSKLYQPGDDVKILSTVTIKPVWIDNGMTMTFKPGEGATGTMPERNIVYGDEFTVPDCNFTKERGTFDGWDVYYSKDGYHRINPSRITIEGSGSASGAAVQNPEKMFDGDKLISHMHCDGDSAWIGFSIDKRLQFNQVGFKLAGQSANGSGNDNLRKFRVEFFSGNTVPTADDWKTGNGFYSLCEATQNDRYSDYVFRHNSDNYPIRSGAWSQYYRVVLENGTNISGSGKIDLYELELYADEKGKLMPGDKIKVDGDVTFVARWKESTDAKVTLTPGANADGTDIVSSTTFDTEYTLPKCTFTRPGHEFAGWQTDTSKYVSNQKITGITLPKQSPSQLAASNHSSQDRSLAYDLFDGNYDSYWYDDGYGHYTDPGQGYVVFETPEPVEIGRMVVHHSEKDKVDGAANAGLFELQTLKDGLDYPEYDRGTTRADFMGNNSKWDTLFEVDNSSERRSVTDTLVNTGQKKQKYRFYVANGERDRGCLAIRELELYPMVQDPAQIKQPGETVKVTRNMTLTATWRSLATLVPEEKNCTTPGHKEYYSTPKDGYFEDAELTIPITDLNTWLADGGNGYIAPLGHNTVTDLRVEPTYDTVGKTQGSHCSRCGEVFVAQQDIPKLPMPVITFSSDSFNYNNTNQVPTITLTQGDATVDASEYTVSYEYNNNGNWESIEKTAIIDAGTYKVKIADNAGGSYNLPTGLEKTFTINKVNSGYSAPENKNAKYNGAPQELLTAPSSLIGGQIYYSLEENGTYSLDIPKATDVGNYFVWFYIKGDKNHNDTTKQTAFASIVNNWQPVKDTEFTVSITDWTKDNVTVNAKDGYLISTQNLAGTADDWAAQLVFGTEGVVKNTFYVKNVSTGEISLGVDVTTKVDKTAPTGAIKIGQTKWQEFVNTITFGLFYKDTQNVKIESADALSGVKSVEYYKSATPMTLDEVKANSTWTTYTDAFNVTAVDNEQFIIYAKITDNANNVFYLSTDGNEFDQSVPVIIGIIDGGTYYTTQIVTVTDDNLESVYIVDVDTSQETDCSFTNNTCKLTLTGNYNLNTQIVAKDKAGNTVTYTVTRKVLDTFAKTITVDDVKSSDKTTLNADKTALEQLKTMPNNATAENTKIDELIASHQTLLDRIALVEGKLDAQIIKDADAITVDEINSDNYKTVTDAETALNDILNNYANNLTADEKSAVDTSAAHVKDLKDRVALVGTLVGDNTVAKATALDVDTAKSSDKTDLTTAKGILENLLTNYSGNLNASETTITQGLLTKTDAMIERIGEVDTTLTAESIGAVKDKTVDDVKSTDKANLTDAKAKLEDVLTNNTGNLTDTEKTDAQSKLDNVNAMLDRLAELDTKLTDKSIKETDNKTPENVKLEDKQNLTDAKKIIEDVLTNNADNLTADEKAELETKLKNINNMISYVEPVENVNKEIVDIPADIKADDVKTVDAIRKAKADYDKLDEYQKSLVENKDLKKLNDAIVAIDYKVVEISNDAKFTKSVDKDLVITVNAAAEKFLALLIDGEKVDKANYTVESGSTIITVKAEYLNTLSEGEHNFTVKYTDDECDGKFTVKNAPVVETDEKSPATGSDFAITFGVVLMLGLSLSLITITNRKKKTNK